MSTQTQQKSKKIAKKQIESSRASSIGAGKSDVNAAEKKITAVRNQKIKPSDAQKELRRVEREIDKLETEIEGITKLRAEHSTDYEKLMELDEREAGLKAHLEELLHEWEEAASMVN